MIRHRLYTKYLQDISNLAEKLDNALDSLPSCADGETMEESEIRNALYIAADKLNDAKRAIEHYSRSAKEGRLRRNSGGKFEIDFNCGDTSYPLSCGSSLEVYMQEDVETDIEEGWHAGRVEHTGGKGYYFYGPGKPVLHDGMRVRTRD